MVQGKLIAGKDETTLIRAKANGWRAGTSGGRVRVKSSVREAKQKSFKRSWKGHY